MSNITVREWIEKFNHGEFDNEDFETQCAAGWYDWFCSTKTLAKKLKRFEPIKEKKEDADDDVRNRLYFGVQCGHPYGSDYMYEIFIGRSGYAIEFKCKNKKEVLQVIDQLAKDFEKEKHQ